MKHIHPSHHFLFTVCLAGALCLFKAPVSAAVNDFYVVFYITQDGITGHVGIAVDNYQIRSRDVLDAGGERVSREDTVRTGALTFFDLWPKQDVHFGAFNHDTEPHYFRLPRTSAEQKITVESLLKDGLPQRYRHACDAMLRIPSSPTEDFQLLAFLDSLPTLRPTYNARRFNCADFAIACLERHFGIAISAREFLPFTWVNTPNRLYRQCLRVLPAVQVLRDPGPKVKRSFFRERILKSIFNKKRNHVQN